MAKAGRDAHRAPWVMAALVVVAGCAAPPAPSSAPPPPTPQVFVGQAGSAQGNYPGLATGATMPSIFLTDHPDAPPCPLYAWDRPLPDGRVLRLDSASCLAPDGHYADVDLGRRIIPYADSLLAPDGPFGGDFLPPPPDVPPTVDHVPPRPRVTIVQPGR